MGKLKDLTLLNFKEFGATNAPSISTLFAAEKYEHQQEIIDYLENGKISLVAPGLEIDEYTGETIIPKHTKAILTDGVYSWSGSLSYYVEKYNARLPHEIEEWMVIQHIKNKTDKSIEVKDEDRKTYELMKVLSAMKHRPEMYFKKGSYYEQLQAFLIGYGLGAHLYEDSDMVASSDIEWLVNKRLEEEYGEQYENMDKLDDEEKFNIYLNTMFSVYANRYPKYAHDVGLC